jgi:hypothetical protein
MVEIDNPRFDASELGPEINERSDQQKGEQEPRTGPAVVIFRQLVWRRAVFIWPVVILHDQLLPFTIVAIAVLSLLEFQFDLTKTR